MNCERIEPNLLDYAKGLLSGVEAEEVKTHLAECPMCVELLEAEKAFAEQLNTIPMEAPQSDVWTLVRARTKPRRFAPFAWMRLATATAARRVTAATVFAALALVTFQSIKPEVEPTKPIQTSVRTVQVNWSDDPLGNHTDAMIDVVDSM